MKRVGITLEKLGEFPNLFGWKRRKTRASPIMETHA